MKLPTCVKWDGWVLTVGNPVLVVRKAILHEGTVSLCTGLVLRPTVSDHITAPQSEPAVVILYWQKWNNGQRETEHCRHFTQRTNWNQRTNLYEWAHVAKVLVHGATLWKVSAHSLHQLTETAVRPHLWARHSNSNRWLVCLLAWGLTALSAQIGYIVP